MKKNVKVTLVILSFFLGAISYGQDQPLIGQAKNIPVNTATSVISISPITLETPERVVPLEVKVSAPSIGKDLPIIILSHGHGNSNYLSSLHGYAPLVEFWAAHGFVVIQPTHLDSKTLQLNPMGPEGPTYWRSRMADITHILDQLDAIEKAFPQLKGRLDKNRIAIAGHSMGGFTAGMLLGEKITDRNGVLVDKYDARIKAGIMMSAPGSGEGLTPMAAKVFADYHPDFTTIKRPILIIAGDEDVSEQETTLGPKWHTEPYSLGNGPSCLITLKGVKHNLGGVSGYDVAETGAEKPETVAVVQRLTWAYLRSALYPEDDAWKAASNAFSQMSAVGTQDCK